MQKMTPASIPLQLFKILTRKKFLLVPILVFWKIFFAEVITFNDLCLACSITMASLYNHKSPLHKDLPFIGVINGSRRA